jgi:hypothetical protein
MPNLLSGFGRIAEFASPATSVFKQAFANVWLCQQDPD